MAKKIDDNALRAILSAKMQNSVGYQGGTLAKERMDALKYYEGKPFGNEVEGRSQVVSRDVAESVDSVMPSLVRIFVGSDQIVAFDPVGPEDEASAKQATEVVNWIVTQKNEAFRTFHTWFKDALLYRLGVIKVYWDEQERSEKEEYKGLTAQEVQAILTDPEVTLVSLVKYVNGVQVASATAPGYGDDEGDEAGEQEPEQIDPMSPVTFELCVERVSKIGIARYVNVPPDEFLVDRRAVDLDDIPFVAHRTKKTATDLIEMGYDRALVDSLPAYDTQDFGQERLERFKQEDEMPWRGGTALDESAKEVWITEAYLRVDCDGDGKAELRRIVCAGDAGGVTILENDETDDHPFCVVSPVPMPHKLFGMSLADQTKDIQLVKSTLWRQMLDSLYLANNPRTWAVEGQVNLDDLLTSRPGGVVRTKTQGALGVLATPSFAEAAFPMIEYMDSVREQRTGVTRYNQGLDASSLNKTATGINIIQNAAQQRLELIARSFAETGVKRLFRRIFELTQKHQIKPLVYKLRNQWVEVNPSEWNSRMDMTVSVGVSTGDKQMQLQSIMQIMGITAQIVQAQGGINGPLVTPTEIYNQAAKAVEAIGFKQPQLFFKDPANAPPQPPAPDPEMAKAQAQMQLEQMKAQQALEFKQREAGLSAQLELQKAQLQAQIETVQAQADIEVQRQKAQVDMEIARQKAEFQAQVDAARAQNDMAEKQRDGESKRAAVKVNVAGSEHMQGLAQTLAQMAEQQQRANDTHAQAIAAMIDKMNKPRRVVRDASGRVAGVE